MAQMIELTGEASITFRTVLDDQRVRIRVWWQPLDEGWYLSLSWPDGRSIASAVRLVERGRPLRGRIGEFRGEFYVDGVGVPGRDAWTSTHRLIYLAPGDVSD